MALADKLEHRFVCRKPNVGLTCQWTWRCWVSRAVEIGFELCLEAEEFGGIVDGLALEDSCAVARVLEVLRC